MQSQGPPVSSPPEEEDEDDEEDEEDVEVEVEDVVPFPLLVDEAEDVPIPVVVEPVPSVSLPVPLVPTDVRPALALVPAPEVSKAQAVTSGRASARRRTSP
ncbi:MAG: hypothetical protein D6705_16980 [Deltaproteobacteria bacterium]|nr:MAG: hypothetical protein D6705_16980 [Deltaproteobacteria bacterium]